MFSRIAIVNRGEAAMRLIHAVRDLNAEASLPDGSGHRIETIALHTEGEKQAKILQAEGLREAAFREAEARERAAEAEAKATTMVSDAIAGGNAQAINYFVAQKYVEAVSEFARSPNAKTILFPVEATQLIGTLGGIGELAREVLGGDDASKPPAQPRSRTVATRGSPPSVPGAPRIEG